MYNKLALNNIGFSNVLRRNIIVIEDGNNDDNNNNNNINNNNNVISWSLSQRDYCNIS